MKEFIKNNQELFSLINEWEPKLLQLPEEVISQRRNSQNRTIKQIVGHMTDSASNNIHRIIHLQYQPSPLTYPDYANLGNNDRWVSIQSYNTESWYDLVQLWIYSNHHLVHVINNVNTDKLSNEWITALNDRVSLNAMIIDYVRHFKLHLSEIAELIHNQLNEPE